MHITKRSRNNILTIQEERNKCHNVVIPYVAGVSEKFRRIFSKHNAPIHFRPHDTMRQKLVHP